MSAGTGRNLPYYRYAQLNSLTLSDNSKYMLWHANDKFQQKYASRAASLPVSFFLSDAQQLVAPQLELPASNTEALAATDASVGKQLKPVKHSNCFTISSSTSFKAYQADGCISSSSTIADQGSLQPTLHANTFSTGSSTLTFLHSTNQDGPHVYASSKRASLTEMPQLQEDRGMLARLKGPSLPACLLQGTMGTGNRHTTLLWTPLACAPMQILWLCYR